MARAEITELDRLRLETEATRTLIGWVASLTEEERPDTKERLKVIVEKARQIMIDVKKRVRAPKATDELETACQRIRIHCFEWGIKDPVFVIERLKLRTYEAFIDGQDVTFGIGTGHTSLEAVLQLHDLVQKKTQRLRQLKQVDP